jgi:large subunit ribosomal protein L20
MAIWNRDKFNRLAKGFLGRRKNCFVVQVRAVFKSLQYQYIWRRLRRRVVKTQYIRKLNAGTRDLDVSYSRFIYGLNRSNIILDRKILSNLAQNEPYSFKAVVDEVKSQVKLPLLNHSEVQYEEAIEKNLLFVGEFVPKDTRDIQARFVMAKDEKNDPFGTRRQDFPYFMKELEKKHAKQFPSIKQMKKHPSDYYDDLPEIEDDDDFKF